MIAPFRTDSCNVIDMRGWHVATCASPALAQEIADALNDAAALQLKRDEESDLMRPDPRSSPIPIHLHPSRT